MDSQVLGFRHFCPASIFNCHPVAPGRFFIGILLPRFAIIFQEKFLLSGMKKSFQDFITEARRSVGTISASEAKALVGDPGVQFIDVRDYSELVAMGRIPGAEHASRGMLEFLVDHQSPYHNKVFASGKKFVLYCMSGGRSLLAAHRMQEMGVENVCSLDGGMKAWLDVGGATESVE